MISGVRDPAALAQRRIQRWAWTGAVAGGLAALVSGAPASWLAHGVAKASQGRLALVDARGTVWTGSARLALTGGADSQDASELPTRLAWTIRPRWNGLRGELSSACCTPQPLGFEMQAGIGRLTLRVDDSGSRWPARLLAGLGTPWNTVQPEGVLALDMRGLSLEWADGRMGVSGTARLDVLDLSSRLSTLRPMGSYRVTITGAGTSTVQLETLEGSLQLSGQGQWVGQRLRFAGEARAAAGREAALSNLLNILGRRSGDRSLISIG